MADMDRVRSGTSQPHRTQQHASSSQYGRTRITEHKQSAKQIAIYHRTPPSVYIELAVTGSPASSASLICIARRTDWNERSERRVLRVMPICCPSAAVVFNIHTLAKQDDHCVSISTLSKHTTEGRSRCVPRSQKAQREILANNTGLRTVEGYRRLFSS